MEGIVRSVVKFRLVDSDQKEDDVRGRIFSEVEVAVVSFGLIHRLGLIVFMSLFGCFCVTATEAS